MPVRFIAPRAEGSGILGAPRLGHKKSRTGCQTCRSRKVKCDEQRPTCHNCSRLGISCTYRSAGASTESPDPSDTRPSPPTSGSVLHDARRMELRLMVFWMSKPDSLDFASPNNPNPEWRRVWISEVPQMALQHDHLLYALLALSATQLSARHPDDTELALAQHHYWAKALHEQRAAVMDSRAKLTEPLTLAAWLISLNSFGMLRGRDLEPYHAPTEWMHASQGAWYLCPPPEAIPTSSILRDVVDLTQPVWNTKPSEDDEEPLRSILRHNLSDQESEADFEACRQASQLIASFRHAVAGNETIFKQIIWIVVFPQIVSTAFIDLLQQCHPRALVILAQFFTTVALSKTHQYFGDARGVIPLREVQAIARVVPEQWRFFVDQCLSEITTNMGSPGSDD